MPRGSSLFIYANQALVLFCFNKSHIYRQKDVHVDKFLGTQAFLLEDNSSGPSAVCYGLNVCVPPPYSYAGLLTPKVMVVGGGPLGGHEVPRVGSSQLGLVPL